MKTHKWQEINRSKNDLERAARVEARVEAELLETNTFENMPKLAAAVDVVLQATDAADLADRLDEMFLELINCKEELAPGGVSPSLAALVEFPYDIRIPLAARRTVMNVFHGLLAGTVLTRVAMAGGTLEPWLARALATTYVDALFSMIRSADIILPVLRKTGFAPLEAHFGREFAEAKRFEEYLSSFFPRDPDGLKPAD